jgi:parvulin-like peptidyl-prolyl isomerase
MSRRNTVKREVRSVLAALAVFLLAAAPSRAQAPATPARTTAASSPTIARVGGLTISRAELDQQEAQAHKVFRDRNQTDLAPELLPLVRRQVLENLIRQRLLSLDAKRRGSTVSEAEAEAQLKRDPAFQENGQFNEAKYMAIKAANPTEYARALAATRDALSARRAGERLDRETQPDRAAIRSQVERELTRATIEHLPLRRAEIDGSYPEPRESEVWAYYTANAERFRRPQEAVLSLVQFNRPAADSTGATEAGYRAWEQRMRGRADSAMSAVRAGARFDDLALLNGGAKKVTLQRDQPADPWRGGPRDVDAAFAAPPGTILPTPVRAAPGWALVRVERVLPSRIAPLREVAREIRRTLRGASLQAREDRLLAEVYAASQDTLRGPGYRVRYAVADTASFAPGEPSAQDLNRYYRAHLADYSTYDRRSGEIVETPFTEAREDVRRRWMRDRRRDMAKASADKLAEAWTRGRRDASLERAMTRVRDLGVVPAVGDPDTGRAGTSLATALTARGGQPGVWTVQAEGAYLVVHLQETVRDYLPTLAQSRTRLAGAVEARRLFDADSTAWRSRAVVHFSRLLVTPVPILDVPLTRDEVERYYRANLDKYSVEELVRVRHILISTTGPGSLPDAQARAKAESLLTLVRGGADFASLAAIHSDDPATRLQGGDVGVFRRGMMREAFERAAFAMRQGDVTGHVRSEVGYHVMECLEYVPPVFHPLVQVYANVAYDCAQKKALRLAGERADSIYRTLKSVEQAKAVGKRLGYDIIVSDHEVGMTGRFDEDLLKYITKIEKLRPNVLYPGTQLYVGLGYVISWVDNVTPPRQLRWEEARDQALNRYRAERGRRALSAKRAELDSMSAAGWSFDSLAIAWGGLDRKEEMARGEELRGMGGRALLDSLAFGSTHPPVLEPGRVTGWIEFPGGFSRLRLVERLAPDPEELDRRAERRAQLVLWRNLRDYFEVLKTRYPVEILDGELRATVLLEPSES